ncbi:hypothetical protein COLO4_36847 [Corchorus olitorius]|uniref:Uncharacterized protein n=1 Tax=Corchorus olitorius TaxID=93759 RepID=A0A1R3G4W0_9ROSI|nr:hypothetical protein COLO4_36847 [Corchorus olitorius]
MRSSKRKERPSNSQETFDYTSDSSQDDGFNLFIRQKAMIFRGKFHVDKFDALMQVEWKIEKPFDENVAALFGLTPL